MNESKSRIPRRVRNRLMAKALASERRVIRGWLLGKPERVVRDALLAALRG